MPVNQVTQLRKQLRGAQAQMHVVKNTLAARAMEDTPLVPIQALFKGQLAVILGYDDPVLPAKVLRDFIKNERCEEKMRLKGGVLDGASLAPERIAAVADLPSKSELLSMFLSALQGPCSRVCGGAQPDYPRNCCGTSPRFRKTKIRKEKVKWLQRNQSFQKKILLTVLRV